MKVSVEDFRRGAKAALPRFVFEYMDGGAELETCLRANRADFDAVSLIPRVMTDRASIDTSIEVFGSKWRYPFAIAPTGLNGLIRPGGDGMLARAANQVGIPFTISTASNQRIEFVREQAKDSEQWLQLYVMQDRDIAEQLVKRAKRSGYRALVLTLDVPVSGHRWRDTRNKFGIPFRVTPQLAWQVSRRPAWVARMLFGGFPQFVNLQEVNSEKVSVELQAALLARAMDRTLVWDSLRWLRSLWDGPLLLKGVLHPEDAKLAVAHGVDGLVVSNHGGRQLDAAISTIRALPRVVDTVPERVPVFLDSGVRTSLDILRAQALGARAVFIGRPVLYGLACGGELGAFEVLRLLASDYERNLILLGATRPSDLREIGVSLPWLGSQ